MGYSGQKIKKAETLGKEFTEPHVEGGINFRFIFLSKASAQRKEQRLVTDGSAIAMYEPEHEPE
ncbi:MAG: hypothetical protein AAB444_01295 [Patescibacteria group bacterium]